MRKFLEFIALLSKTFILSSLSALILLAVFSFIAPTLPHGRAPLPATVRPEQKASHYLLLRGAYRALGTCTGTAIGPHAILTAAHCDQDDSVRSVQIDLATETHEILSTATDGRDHIILLVDGTPFTNIEKVVYDVAVVGQPVVFYGVGGGHYPPVAKYGFVEDCQDPSDLDAAAGQFCFGARAIPGDSGSAVYDAEGHVVGIVTYLDRSTEPSSTIGYALNFTEKQIADASSFDGVKTPKPVVAVEHKKTCDLFSAAFGGCR